MSKEKWKRVHSQKDYLISSWGRVFSIKSKKMMKPQIHQSRSNKYLRIRIGGTNYMVHVLVAFHFKQKQFKELKLLYPNETYQVDHKDRNTLNPNLNNLDWVTERENKLLRYETDVFKFNGIEYKLGRERNGDTKELEN